LSFDRFVCQGIEFFVFHNICVFYVWVVIPCLNLNQR
jgi:hypothetical protein